MKCKACYTQIVKQTLHPTEVREVRHMDMITIGTIAVVLLASSSAALAAKRKKDNQEK